MNNNQRIYFANNAKSENFKPFTSPIQNRKPQIIKKNNLIVVNGDKFALLSAEEGLIAESMYLNKKDKWFEDFFKIDKVEKVSVPTIVIGNPGYKNYYHWVYQIWMSLLYLKSNLSDFSDYQVLGPPLNGWRKQYLEILGIKNYVEASVDKSYFISNAVFTNVSWGGFSYAPSDVLLDLIRELDFGKVEQGANLIYISRKDTKLRGVSNEDDLIERLEKQGFKSVILSELTVVEQIRLFRSATFIVAPHGAGLTNIIFCRPDATLVELLPDDYINPCFYSIAEVMGLKYAATVNPVSDVTKHYHNNNMHVDIDLLVNTLAGLGISFE